MKQPAVYILASKINGTLYIGVTSDLIKRIWQHRNDIASVFARKHACKLLVWYQRHETMSSAIVREKQLKGGSRMSKGLLIAAKNPLWRDLFDEIA